MPLELAQCGFRSRCDPVNEMAAVEDTNASVLFENSYAKTTARLQNSSTGGDNSGQVQALLDKLNAHCSKSGSNHMDVGAWVTKSWPEDVSRRV